MGLPSPNPTKSYWLKELSPVLEGHRTTEELPGRADVVVVGSGVTGAFAGWFLKMGCDGDGFDGDGEEREMDGGSEGDDWGDEKFEGYGRGKGWEGESADGDVDSDNGCCGLKEVVAGLFRRDKGGEVSGKEKNDQGDGLRSYDESYRPELGTEASRKGKVEAQSVVMLEAREACSGATGPVSLILWCSRPSSGEVVRPPVMLGFVRQAFVVETRPVH